MLVALHSEIAYKTPYDINTGISNTETHFGPLMIGHRWPTVLTVSTQTITSNRVFLQPQKTVQIVHN